MRFYKLLFPILGTIFALSTVVHAKEIAIIVNKNSPLTQVSSTELADIYLGQEEVVGNVRLKPIDQNDNQEIRGVFLKKILRMTHEAYINHWNHRLFREGGIPPLLKSDSAEVIRTVKEKQGAIGYVWESEARGVDGVRVIMTFDSSE
jgi:ABC-type phosphate transport system substrate-binding protein